MVGGRILARTATFAASCVALLGFAESATARTFRVKDIPNGATFKCLSCHTTNSGKTFTPFGSDAKSHLFGTGSLSTRHTAWAEFCARDSDMDGYTNGQELGDPGCVWAIGDANPGGLMLTNPGKDTSFPMPVCGNGMLDAGEDCEGSELTASTCAEVGAGDGALACTAECTYDASGCSGTLPPRPTSGGDDSGESSCSVSSSPGRAAGDPDASGALAAVAAASAACLIGLSARRRKRCR